EEEKSPGHAWSTVRSEIGYSANGSLPTTWKAYVERPPHGTRLRSGLHRCRGRSARPRVASPRSSLPCRTVLSSASGSARGWGQPASSTHRVVPGRRSAVTPRSVPASLPLRSSRVGFDAPCNPPARKRNARDRTRLPVRAWVGPEFSPRWSVGRPPLVKEGVAVPGPCSNVAPPWAVVSAGGARLG